MPEANGIRIIAGSAIGAGIGALCSAAIIFVMAAVLAASGIPAPLIMPLATVALAIGGFAAGIPFFDEIPVKHNPFTVILSRPYTAERRPPWPSSLGQASRCWRSLGSRG